MPMNDNPDEINDAERQIQARLYQEAQGYAETRKESAVLNKKRATSRKKIEEMGFRTDAYQVGIRIVKDLSDRERKDFMRDLKLVVDVLGKRQADLFPDEALKAAKREEARKAENKPKSKAAADAKSDASKRSDPKSGGAGKKRNGVPAEPPSTLKETVASGDAMIDEVAARRQAQAAAEQEEGARALDRIRNPPAEPKSQSQLSAEKLEAAKLN